MHKFLFIIFFILILSCSNSKNKDNSNNKVEIILSNKDSKDSMEIKKYDENVIKELAVNSLKEFLSLPYSAEGVWKAYEKFYSSTKNPN